MICTVHHANMEMPHSVCPPNFLVEVMSTVKNVAETSLMRLGSIMAVTDPYLWCDLIH